ncbi:MAG: hypothetical protein K2P03_11275 [Lachnospiraceae bacterium]|jgi:hypothetical protein|nr:hypothetical protein [Lachnospiraceae bacterium]
MKKNMLLMMSVCMLVFTSIIPVSAKDINTIKPSNIEAEREDVSLEEALQDPTFSLEEASKEESALTRATTYWKVWGEMEYRQSDNTARPVGYSQHISDGKVLNTYHYTRTYLDNGVGGKKGDSGRQWGYGTVRAVGTYCMIDVWDTAIHTVKYGTED